MPIELSDGSRDLLVRSLPLMERGKGPLVGSLGRYLSSEAGEAGQDCEPVAAALTDMLLTQARHLLRSGTLRDVDRLRLEHAGLDLHGRHYSRFGDALAPVIRDVLGPKAPREVAGAWGDVFWSIVRAVQARDGGSATAPGPTRRMALVEAPDHA